MLVAWQVSHGSQRFQRGAHFSAMAFIACCPPPFVIVEFGEELESSADARFPGGDVDGPCEHADRPSDGHRWEAGIAPPRWKMIGSYGLAKITLAPIFDGSSRPTLAKRSGSAAYTMAIVGAATGAIDDATNEPVTAHRGYLLLGRASSAVVSPVAVGRGCRTPSSD